MVHLIFVVKEQLIYSFVTNS